jgi:peptidoglycan biosynthesis protein MviN/MurJ (putative lipid II flippase)
VSTACYTFILPAVALEAVLMQAFFANRRVISVTVMGVLFSILSVAISFLGLALCGPQPLETRGLGRVWSGYDPVVVLGFISGGFALTRLLKTVALSWMLKQNARVFPVGETLGFLTRVAVCTIVTALCAWLALQGVCKISLLSRLHEKIQMAAQVCAGGAGGVLGALAGFWLLRIREPYEMLAWLSARVKRRETAK